MKLTEETARNIKVGDVVKFELSNETKIGVVNGTPADGSWGILCNGLGKSTFGIGKTMFDGKIRFEIMDEHEPVRLYGLVYDFVSNH